MTRIEICLHSCSRVFSHCSAKCLERTLRIAQHRRHRFSRVAGRVDDAGDNRSDAEAVIITLSKTDALLPLGKSVPPFKSAARSSNEREQRRQPLPRALLPSSAALPAWFSPACPVLPSPQSSSLRARLAAARDERRVIDDAVAQ